MDYNGGLLQRIPQESYQLPTPSDTVAENIDRRVRSLREDILRPFADKFGFPLGNKRSATGLLTVLLLGNHSSGKSTFINHLAGADIQDTGVAPTDDSFTLLMYGDVAKTDDGRPGRFFLRS